MCLNITNTFRVEYREMSVKLSKFDKQKAHARTKLLNINRIVIYFTQYEEILMNAV